FFFQAEDGIRDPLVTGVQTCALPIWRPLDGWVRVRNAWSDVRDVESEDVPIPSNRLVPIRDDDCDRVDAEDSHILPKGRNGIPRYELARDLRRITCPRHRDCTSWRTTP